MFREFGTYPNWVTKLEQDLEHVYKTKARKKQIKVTIKP